ncbi:hypothetical protein AJ78_08449 [Emergomyces pasteurianus Ep9510]|uniref:uS12 prolyl 3,4-dihydroxylase n=1 Tax=Emergomyces pasteurianus Ep9510 TaxID=1447872 RepID=A0A1J9PRU9_9EURO|nr:hypothetical protein AJ78_08449 [Emergomyces pasteurianus Ep9510]
MKRKTTSARNSLDGNGQPDTKKRVLDNETIKSRFHDGLLDRATLEQYKQSYATSAPYKHGVISPLINPALLRSVRTEIQEHLSFTEKETDIYKIFQSGDLANLDGLDDASLSKLPSLLELRDALYSAPFRKYLSEVTGAGDLSGRKTDMAINVYTGGCHLLCHDDVIGSRRVSYILYLTDPDVPWQPSWGGALRLYPTTVEKDESGKEVKVPSPDHTLSIPPAFNQLSFFTVQPGESFHDVEEVYSAGPNGDKGGKERVRMAISGWYHIPQDGEDGYEEGLEEKLAERSSLQQLQSSGDTFDQPQPQVTPYEDGTAGNGADKELTTADFEFLLKYISPSYLTPDITEDLSESFTAECSLSLERFLHDKFATRLREYIEEQEKESNALPTSSHEIEQKTGWKVSRPPHKHRYLYQQPRAAGQEIEAKTPIQELLEDLLPSQAFKKWVSVATGCSDLLDYNILARRFRRGEDYTLASGYEGETPRLEFTIGLTPTSGWEKEADEDEEEEEEGEEEEEEEENGEVDSKAEDKAEPSANGKEQPPKGDVSATEDHSVGGYEIYMAGDDDDEEEDEEEEEEDEEETKEENSTNPKTKKSKKSDPAIYKASSGADGDDGILFSMAAGWNRMSIVLRDSGTLKFVKYVSRSAAGDRWDVTGEIGLKYDEMDVDQSEGEGEDEAED